MEKIKVLIADNINTVAQLSKNIILEKENMEVIGISNNGKDEYNKISELQPDIVITSNELPKMKGLTVIKKILNSNIENKPQFILVTENHSFNLFVEYKKLGIDILYKPFDKKQLLYILKNLEYKIESVKILK